MNGLLPLSLDFGFWGGSSQDGMRTVQHGYELTSGGVRIGPMIAGDRGGQQDPVLRIVDDLPGFGRSHETQLHVFHALREMIPVIDSAMGYRRMLEGRVMVEASSQRLEDELNEFVESVPVGLIGESGTTQGLNWYLDALANAGDEYGLGVGEILTTARGTEFERLVVRDSRNFKVRQEEDDSYELIQTQRGGDDVPISGPKVQRIAFSYDGNTVWPQPMIWGCTLISEVIARIYTAANNLYWRAADPTNLYSLEYEDGAHVDKSVSQTLSDGTTVDVDEQLAVLRDIIEQTNLAKSVGRAVDAFFSVQGAEISKEPIFDSPATNSLASFIKDHYQTLGGSIISAGKVPPWLFPDVYNRSEGIGSERAQQQANVALDAAKQRRKIKRRLAREIINQYLMMQGRSGSFSRYTVEFEVTNILDEKVIQQARSTMAEADTAFINAANMLFDPPEDGGREGTVMSEEALDWLDSKGVRDPFRSD